MFEYIDSVFPPYPHLNVAISGQSGVGKSQFANEFIKSIPQLYPNYKVRKLNIIGPKLGSQYAPIISKYPNYEYFNDLTEESLDRMIDLPTDDSISICYFDDCSYKIFDNPLFEKLLTTKTRHEKLMVIVTLQALFQKSSQAFRTCLRQFHLLYLGNSFRERNSICTLFTQLYGKNASKMCQEVLEATIKEQQKRYNNPFYFLLIRLDPFCANDKRIIFDSLANIPLIFKPNGH